MSLLGLLLLAVAKPPTPPPAPPVAPPISFSAGFSSDAVLQRSSVQGAKVYGFTTTDRPVTVEVPSFPATAAGTPSTPSATRRTLLVVVLVFFFCAFPKSCGACWGGPSSSDVQLTHPPAWSPLYCPIPIFKRSARAPARALLCATRCRRLSRPGSPPPVATAPGASTPRPRRCPFMEGSLGLPSSTPHRSRAGRS